MASREKHFVIMKALIQKADDDSIPREASRVLLDKFQDEANATCYNHIDELIAMCDPEKIADAERELLPLIAKSFHELIEEIKKDRPARPSLPPHIMQLLDSLLMPDNGNLKRKVKRIKRRAARRSPRASR